VAFNVPPARDAGLPTAQGVLTPVRAARRRVWLLVVPFVAPSLIFYTVFLIVPLLGTLALSFTDWSGISLGNIRFVGLANYRQLGSDSVFWESLQHNLIFLLGAILLKTTLALLLALALEQNLRFSSFFRGVYLMPTVISLVVVGIVFSLALSPSLGLINPFLQAIGLGQFAGSWLGDPQKVLPLVIVIDTWHGFGLYMFLFITRLITIPQELHDAAFVDGASGRQDIWYVTLPLLKSTAAMVVLLAAIESLKAFALIYVMTNGGPNHQSEVLSTWAYFNAFTANKVGYGSAILVVLLLITFCLAYIQVTRFQPKDNL
jgi:raffinose/stachyose/melibiose transport system permease protein